MSGGVDSSVTAALLQKQGFLVAGAYMKNFSEESWSGVLAADCPWQQDVADAKAVCDKLGIEFRSFNFEKEYADKVVEYFFAEYAAGRTPNPDIMCNKEIKFGLFLDKALELGCDYIATGHYARAEEYRIKNLESGFEIRDSRFRLLKGLDPKKDQSYFLYALTQEQLSKTLFPIGEYTKPQVMDLARKLGLPNADKKDSQGVCFVGHINLREFLKQRIPERVGEIVDSSGRVIGSHPGAWYYTIGQREGLGIGARPLTPERSDGGLGTKPYYVVQKDVVKNKLIVSHEVSSSKTLTLRDIHWIGETPKLPLKCAAKIRYQQPDQECKIFSPSRREGGDGEGVRVEFSSPQFAPASGQSIVFYDGDTCLGGGIIA